jgi:hypothetical protein
MTSTSAPLSLAFKAAVSPAPPAPITKTSTLKFSSLITTKPKLNHFQVLFFFQA